MRLGILRHSDLSVCSDPDRIRDELLLADELGFQLAYFPNFAPENVEGFQSLADGQVAIGLDAHAFGAHSPRKLETLIRDVNDQFGGRLVLGVQMCCGKVSTKCRVAAQIFETLFSSGSPREESFAASHFPMKPPCPDVIGLPAKGTSEEVALAAARGYLPFTACWLAQGDVAYHWPAIVEGATSAHRRACSSTWNVARMIVVHDDPTKIDAYVFGSDSPIRAYFSQLVKRGVLGPDVDAHLNRLVIAGTSDQVAESIQLLQDNVGEIGTLHMVVPKGSDPEMTRKTMVCLAGFGMPMVRQGAYENLERT